MTKHPFYFGFGIAVIVLATLAELRGWATTKADRAHVDAPRSVRENPGAYRPIYIGNGGRYLRGK